MPTRSCGVRHVYRGELAAPLRAGQYPTSKLPALFDDLRVGPGSDSTLEALMALASRHISGFRRGGPKSRRYEGPLRHRLKANEKPEIKLPLLMRKYDVSSYEDCLIAVARAHVPGFKTARRDTAGRKPTVLHDDVLFEIVSGREPGTKKLAVLYEISSEESSTGDNNPWRGVEIRILEEAIKPSKVRARTDALIEKAVKGYAELTAKRRRRS